MALILPGNLASATAATGFDVDNSCRFNASDTSLTKSISSTNTSWTVSLWVKRAKLGATQYMISWGDSGATNAVGFSSADKFQYFSEATSSTIATAAAYRDPSAWYHLVAKNSSGTITLYVNGVAITTTGGTSGSALSSSTFRIGGYQGGGLIFGGYMSEVCFIDSSALNPTSFGEFDSDSPTIWKPIDVSGLTFNTDGFYCDFEASANLGNDANGGTDLDEDNIAAADQASDSPTNNFATINPLDNFYANATLSEGNLKMVSGSSRECSSTATIALSNGKWFWEYEVTTFSAPFGGIQPIPSFGNTASAAVLQTNGLGYLKTGKVETTDGSGGSTELASYATYAVNDIIGVALDLDAGTNIIYFYKNGALQGSGVNLTHVDSTANGHYLIAFGAVSGQDTFEINFGNPITALDSANADANGYGAFEFAVPSGFFSICTKNLAEYG